MSSSGKRGFQLNRELLFITMIFFEKVAKAQTIITKILNCVHTLHNIILLGVGFQFEFLSINSSSIELNNWNSCYSENIFELF